MNIEMHLTILEESRRIFGDITWNKKPISHILKELILIYEIYYLMGK
jgi:hypothetical protein